MRKFIYDLYIFGGALIISVIVAFSVLMAPAHFQVATGFSLMAFIILYCIFISTDMFSEISQENRDKIIDKLQRKLTKYQTVQYKAQGKNAYQINYATRQSIISDCEFDFYKALQNVVPSCYLLLPKVQLVDIFKKKEQWKDIAGYYSRCHIDFLIVDPQDAFQPIMGIELDDPSHNSSKARAKDKFKDTLFASCELPLERFGVSPNGYKPSEIQEKISKHLSNISANT